jgi:hypothetical protein
VHVDLPPISQNAQIGVLDRKHASYDIWSLGERSDQLVGGEEIRALSCMLPKKGTRELYQGTTCPSLLLDVRKLTLTWYLLSAPKPIARHIVISAQPVLPTPNATPESVSDSVPMYKNPPRQQHSKELLVHKFMPYGSNSRSNDKVLHTAVEDLFKGDERPGKEESMTNLKTKTKTKRKKDGESPTKSREVVKSGGDVPLPKGVTKKRKGEEESPRKPKKARILS